jgi:hypothetical protein
MYLIEVVFVQLTSIILKGVAKAIEHCIRTQVKFTVATAIYALEMTASANPSALDFAVHLGCMANPPGVIMVHFQHSGRFPHSVTNTGLVIIRAIHKKKEKICGHCGSNTGLL